jgi:hypothetical protein
MLEIKSPTEELKPEQQAILDAIEAEKPKVEPEVAKPEEKAEVVKPTEEIKEEVMLPDESDVEEDNTSPERQPKFVRLEKHLKIRDRMKELEEELAIFKSKPQTTMNEIKQEEALDEVRAYAEENGYDAEQTAKLVSLIEKGAYSRLEKQFADKFNQLNEVAEKAKRDNEEVEQEKIWNKQYSELVDKYSDEKEHIESIKENIKNLAFSKEFHQSPLSAVYVYLKEVEGLKPPTKTKTVESGTGGQSKGGIDYARVIADNDEQAIKNMSSEEFTEFQKYIKSNNL